MEVGDYVRTKSGGIGKTIEIDNNASCSHIITDNETFGLGWDGEQVNWDFITEIVKSSPNIIDLIEEGDYVNGVRVDEIISKDDKEICFRYKYSLDKDDVYTLLKEDVKSILTKEQFEAMEYRIGE